MPRLQTLSLPGDVLWQTGTFRGLRHLILRIVDASSLVDLVRGGLMAVLALNTLEDLVMILLCDGNEEKDLEEALDEVGPMDVPSIKRLAVKGGGASLFHTLIEPKLVLHDCARDYTCEGTPWNLDGARLGESNSFPMEKLFISSSWIACTNGTAAMRVRVTAIEPALSSFIDARDVQELWLWRAWNKLVILVLEDNVHSWLSEISKLNLFPALSELQLHSTRWISYPTLTEFLARRKEDGHAIETLRLVVEPTKFKNAAEFFEPMIPQFERVHGELSGSRILETVETVSKHRKISLKLTFIQTEFNVRYTEADTYGFRAKISVLIVGGARPGMYLTPPPALPLDASTH
ncbi:hypothetical protein BDW22DRAFT_1432426 [Trametopsis cervina]|nr:hypothetical protein BDW22DRAFT_1432426 [Trametopsis cervina]